ncbi:MAG: hypothetical protein K9K65_10260 [Desulfarculaceae bacterium]|nr:hypothetical protein [Desulfarculaceae bacterium]MCF8048491.1 hypothetical protein [Desulfarculaceae bacterium]MCF8098213.1 hypothetical protein [Desulfarculaceae bacterium]MCF8123559.1 hypothetical protein [Desulfarculaceae bacterium]
MDHQREQFKSQDAKAGVRSRSAAFFYFYYYAPATETVSLPGVRKV